MKSPFKKCIGIDPGKGGGLAVITDETVKVYPCPQTVEDMAMLIGICLNDVSAYRTRVFLERCGLSLQMVGLDHSHLVKTLDIGRAY